MDIEDVYSLLPEFQCIPGCIECCQNFGVASRTRVEDERIREYLRAQGREPLLMHGTTCPYVSQQGCTIYPVRPLICRLYGTSPNYQCIMGAKPMRLLHEDEEVDIFNYYYSNFA
jgi:uncharacterized protein